VVEIRVEPPARIAVKTRSYWRDGESPSKGRESGTSDVTDRRAPMALSKGLTLGTQCRVTETPMGDGRRETETHRNPYVEGNPRKKIFAFR